VKDNKLEIAITCPHCNKYWGSRNVLVGKKAICRKCRGEMLISKQGVKRIRKTFGKNVVKLFFFISIIFTLHYVGPTLLYIIFVLLGAAGVIHPF
tara:strand:+ start:199 stop:483 length:285 start_codon:yes stop_codon:yes gene_type:complete